MSYNIPQPTHKVYRVNSGTGVFEVLHEFPDLGLFNFAPQGRLIEVPPNPGHLRAFLGVTWFGGNHDAGEHDLPS